MDYQQFKEKHLIYSEKQDRYVAAELSVLNIAYGPEAVRVAMAMGASSQDLMNKIKTVKDRPDDGRYSSLDYVSMHSYAKRFSITTGDDHNVYALSKNMYQPEFEKHIIKAQAEFGSDFMPDEEADKELVNEMYAALGMNHV